MATQANYDEYQKLFPTERSHIDYLHKLRWGKGLYCPRCNCTRIWHIDTEKYQCRECHYQFSLFSKTLLHRTHLPLSIWFRAVLRVLEYPEVINAKELNSELNIDKDSAANVLRKIRQAMANTLPKSLKGNIYVNLMESGNRFYFIAVNENEEILLGGSPDFLKDLDNNKEDDCPIFMEDNLLEHMPASNRFRQIKDFSYVVDSAKKQLQDMGLINHRHIARFNKSNDEYFSECQYKYLNRNRSKDLQFYEILENLIKSTPS